MPTLCFTGMDRAEEGKLKQLFSEVNVRLGGEWNLVPEAQARVLVVDMESIYGHMTWLKTHASKYVIAISSRADSEAAHVLLRPVTLDSLADALQEASSGTVTNAAAITSPHPASPHPATQTTPPVSKPIPARAPEPPPAPAPAVPQQATPKPTAVAAPPVAPPPAPAAPRRMAPSPARDPVMWDYLQPGGLQVPSRLEVEGAPALIIDPRTDTYVGGPTLKPYIAYCEQGSVRLDRWHTMTGAEVNKHLTGSNVMQPLARLRWLYALIQGHGELAPGYEPDSQFRLTKWPKAEREFPKHMRIATAMMQAPGTPQEIAAKSDTPLSDVNDFINASLESGFAEVVAAVSPGPAPGPKPGGLLGRLRGGR